MEKIEIIAWHDNYAQDFVSLSVEWLEKYVSVEPGDLAIIHHPYEIILNPGGNIFFARISERIVGTVAMIKSDPDTFELAKLAVTEEYKGRKIGDQLMQKALQFAKDNGAKRVILYSNQKLLPAIKLYEKYKFKEIPLEHNKYLESDIMMELSLS